MKQRPLFCLGVAAITFCAVTGCQSMALKSSDEKTRMTALAEVKDQQELTKIAINAEYPSDVRSGALARVTGQREIWKIWCYASDDAALSSQALKAINEEEWLLQIALLQDYQESKEEENARASKENVKSFAVAGLGVASKIGALAGSKEGVWPAQ